MKALPAVSSAQTHRRPEFAARAGALIIEMILSVTILLLCTMALVEWTFTAYSIQAVNSAAAEGSRTAAGVFTSAAARNASVQSTVLAVLTPLGFDSTGLTINVVNSTNHVTVTVTVPVSSSPIPNLLNSFGLTLGSKSLRSSCVAWSS